MIGLHILYGGVCPGISAMFIDKVEGNEVFIDEFIPEGILVVNFLEKLIFGHDV